MRAHVLMHARASMLAIILPNADVSLTNYSPPPLRCSHVHSHARSGRTVAAGAGAAGVSYPAFLLSFNCCLQPLHVSAFTCRPSRPTRGEASFRSCRRDSGSSEAQVRGALARCSASSASGFQTGIHNSRSALRCRLLMRTDACADRVQPSPYVATASVLESLDRTAPCLAARSAVIDISALPDSIRNDARLRACWTASRAYSGPAHESGEEPNPQRKSGLRPVVPIEIPTESRRFAYDSSDTGGYAAV